MTPDVRGPLFEVLRNFEAFFEKVIKTNNHWLYIGSLNKKGYGYFSYPFKRTAPIKAHVYSYTMLVGKIPGGYDVHHKCRQKNCVNPEHLELRHHNTHSITTHCPYGHPFNEENTHYRIRPDGRVNKQCRTCDRSRHEDARDRKKHGTS